MSIRRLRPADAPGFVALRVAALRQEPLAFASSLSDEHSMSLEVVRKALAGAGDEVVLGYFDQAELCGTIGAIRAPKAKHHHKAELWGLYVVPEFRRRGVGRALLTALIDHVRDWDGIEQLQLGVTSDAVAATRLFESAGFVRWGLEPRALRSGGVFVDEAHMSMVLGEAAPVN
jgi:ribosomal protein S18 acetylase RimI-like enzyme